jgi:hypothetical protein
LYTAQSRRVAEPGKVRRTSKNFLPCLEGYQWLLAYRPLLTTHKAVRDETSMTVRHGLGKQDDYKAPRPLYLGIQDLPGGYHPFPGQFQVGLDRDCQRGKEVLLYLYLRRVRII